LGILYQQNAAQIVFAMAHIQWKRTLAVYRDALKQAELGLYAQLENFAKKQLCASWTPTVLGNGG